MAARSVRRSHVRRLLLPVAVWFVLVSGTGCPPTPPSITFSQTQTSTTGDNATTVFAFTSPALGNNPSVLGSFRVEDTSPVVGNEGTYQIEVWKGATPVASAGPFAPGQPTLLSDVNFSAGNPPGGGTAFEVRVIEVGGPTPRNFRLTMSPRYATPVPVSSPQISSISVAQGEFKTFALNLAPANVGEIDFYLRESDGIGGTNTLTVLALDRVTPKASLSGSADVSLDNSLQGNLALSASGEYLLIVQNTSTATRGYNLIVGPHPVFDQLVACEPVGAPGFGSDTNVDGKQLFPEADRDCYAFSLGFGVSGIGFVLDETGTTPGSNEVRVFRDGTLVTAKKGNTDVSGVADVEASGAASYQVVVNNLADGMPSYDLSLSLDGPCIGPSCILSHDSSVALDFALENPATRLIRADQAGTALQPDAIVSFQFDRTSSGTFEMRVRDSGGGLECGTPISSAQDFFIENCDLTTPDGLPYTELERTAGTGTSATVRMGPNLRPKLASPVAITPGFLVPEQTLGGFGDANVYGFDVAVGQQLGIGFDDQGIGSGNNVVKVCPAADAVACLTNPGHTPTLSFNGSADGGVEAKPVTTGGAYVLIVDNSGLGSGDYEVCVGPGGESDSETPITLNVNLAPGQSVSGGGGLTCGDTDFIPLTTLANQDIRITAEEAGSVVGAIILRLEIETLPNGSGIWTLVAQDSGSGLARIPSAAVQTGRNYRLVIDNDSVGGPGYGITITDPAS